jgi:membrane-associated phospholipid phosphatase
MIRLWPLISVLAMLLLGWAVGERSTPVDDWFQRYRHSPAHWLLFFTDPPVLAILLAAGLAAALVRRQWRLAVVMLLAPPVAIALARLVKRLFDREKGGALAYPSGHTTLAVVVLGMVVLAVGAALWARLGAVTVCALGVLGQAVTYHYFTDTVGAVLLGTAVVCLAARIALPPPPLDTCQPRCDVDHNAR